jgi:hypothetical protein
MIETQIIKKSNKPIAVILDYNQYLKLKELEEDKKDYESAMKTKKKNKVWHNHGEVKKMLKKE